MKKFIIKINDWCIYFVEGEMQELTEKLKSLGVLVKDTCPCNEENLGVLFDTCINTKTMCCGWNPEATEKALSDVEEYLIQNYGEKLAKNIIHNYDVKHAFSVCFKDIPHCSHLVKVLVESDEKYQPKPGVCIIPREYDQISDIDDEEFWNSMWRLVGLSKA